MCCKYISAVIDVQYLCYMCYESHNLNVCDLVDHFLTFDFQPYA